MDGARFDRLVQWFGRNVSRRALLGGLLGFLFAGGQRLRASANQLTPPTCGASGDVCTMLVGCCDGLTCVTSAINTNYGVCVAGEGGTVSVGTTLISPFSENVEQEVAAIAASETTSTTTSTTTDTETEREQQIAERNTRQSTQRTRRQTNRSTQKTRRQGNRDDHQENRELRRGPKIKLELFLPANGTDPEILKVTNRDDSTMVLSRIESVPPIQSIEVTPEQSLGVGDSFFFVSGGPNSEQGIKGNRHGWSTTRICEDLEGFTVYAALSIDSVNHQHSISCDESTAGNAPDRRKKRRRKQNGGKDKNKN